jgi:hypothetical protein
VVAVLESVDTAPAIAASVQQYAKGKIRLKSVTVDIPPKQIRAKGAIVEAKPGSVVFVDRGISDVSEKIEFTFELALNEPGVSDGQPIVGVLNELADVVDGIVKRFRPFLEPATAVSHHPAPRG